jgi:hypothetical protein
MLPASSKIYPAACQLLKLIITRLTGSRQGLTINGAETVCRLWGIRRLKHRILMRWLPTVLLFGIILPSALIVTLTLNFPATIILESSLSFLGIGIQPPMTSLGNMLGFGRDYLTTAWWIAVLPGVSIFLATLAMSILGDWVRDRLDPTLR